MRSARRVPGPAMGRYAGDVYYSGGAYYFSTLGAAELCYLAACRMAPEAAQPWLQRGDAFLETVRAFTPPSGDLSEQFDQKTGAQSSSRQSDMELCGVHQCGRRPRPRHGRKRYKILNLDRARVGPSLRLMGTRRARGAPCHIEVSHAKH